VRLPLGPAVETVQVAITSLAYLYWSPFKLCLPCGAASNGSCLCVLRYLVHSPHIGCRLPTLCHITATIALRCCCCCCCCSLACLTPLLAM
jgi:hypothetical protein